MLYRLSFYDPEGCRTFTDYDRMSLIREDVVEGPAVRGFAGPEVDQFDPPSFTYRYPTGLVEYAADYARQFAQIGDGDVDSYDFVFVVIEQDSVRRVGYNAGPMWTESRYAEPCRFVIDREAPQLTGDDFARLARVTVYGTPACGY